MAESSNRQKDIFLQALDLTAPEARAAFLAEACGADADLRRQIEAMLQAHAAADSFLEKPAAVLGNTVDAPPILPATRTAEPSLAEAVGTRIGPYKLLQQIGEGGMGIVYMAEQQEPVRRLVALKIIKPGMDSAQVLARFEAERQALALMDHPNIAKVYDAATTPDGRPFFVMELVKGTPITTYCDANKLSPRQRLELFIPVCQAIQHAHQKGIIHRDIKPTNLLIALYDDRPVPKVIDFGIAKATGQALTERTLHTVFGAIVGTPEYMSPEQATFNQLDIDTRSDVYSLGVLLYELLTGTTPVDKARLKEAAILEVLRVVREEEPPRPSVKLSTTEARATIAATRGTEPDQLAQLLRGELDWIVMKALEKDRNQRYDSANSLARDVERYLRDEPVEACPPSFGYRLRKAARKHRTLLTTTALIALLLIGGIVISTWQAIRATRAEDLSLKAETKAKQDRQDTLEANKLLRDTEHQLQETIYAARSNLIQSAWDTHNIHEMDLLLDEQRPTKGSPDLRGFEWHNWRRLVRKPVRTVRYAGNMMYFQLTTDGTKLVGKEAGMSIDTKQVSFKMLDAQTGAEIGGFPLPLRLNSFVDFSLAMASLSADGELVGYEDTIYATRTGKVVAKVPGKILALSGDGQKVAWTPPLTMGLLPPPPGELLRIKVWEVASRKELQELRIPAEISLLLMVMFSPQGDQLAYFGGFQPLFTDRATKAHGTVYRLATGKKVLDLPPNILSVAFSPDGKRLLTSSAIAAHRSDMRGEIKMWDLTTGDTLVQLPDQEDAFCLCFSANGAQFAGISFRGTLTVRDTSQGHLQFCAASALQGNMSFLGKEPRLAVVDWNEMSVFDASPPPPPLLTVSRSKHAQTLDAIDVSWQGTGFEPNVALNLHTGILGLCPLNSPTPTELLLLDLQGNELAHWDFRAGTDPLLGFALSERGNRLALQRMDKEGTTTRVEVYQLMPTRLLFDRKTKVSVPKGSLHSKNFYAVLSPDGSVLAQFSPHLAKLHPTLPSATSFFDVTLFAIDGDKKGWKLERPHSFVQQVAFSHDGRQLASLFLSPDLRKCEVVLWDLATRQEVRSWSVSFADFQEPLLSFNRQDDKLALALARKHVDELIVWETATGKMVFTREIPSQTISSLAFSPDGRRLVTSSGMAMFGQGKGTIAVYDMAGRRLASWKAHGGDIRSVCFTPDGHRLFSIGARSTRPGDLIQEWNATPVPD